MKASFPRNYSDVHSAVVDDNIWLFFVFYHQTLEKWIIEISVFDTRSLETTKIKCQTPDFTDPYRYISQITSHLDQIYLVMKGYRQTKLLKFCTKSLIFTEVCELETIFKGRVQIIGDQLHSLAVNRERTTVSLVRINLTNKEVETKILNIELTGKDPQLMFNNDKLYLFQHFEGRFEVFLIEKDELQKLEMANTDGKCAPWMCSEDGVITNPSIWPTGTSFLETVDFENNQWISETIENNFNSGIDSEWKSVTRIGDTLYAVHELIGKNEQNRDIGKFVISVLELEPKLSDICLLQLVDQWTNEIDKEKENFLLETLPIPLRCKFMNMLKWRMSKNFGDVLTLLSDNE